MPRFMFAGLVIVFSMIWSSAFVAGAVALRDFDPTTLLTIRFAASALLLLPLCLLTSAPTFTADVVGHGLGLGVLNNAIYLGLSFAALRTVRPEVVIVVVSCAPFVTTLLSAAFGLERIRAMSVAGAVLAFAGVVMVSGVVGADVPDLGGLSLAIGGMIAFAAATVLFRKSAGRLPLLQVNFWQSVAGAVVLLPVALLWGQPIGSPSPSSLLALAHLVVVVTIGGMALWLLLIRKSGAATASTYHLLNPFSGALLAHLVLGAPLRATDFAGATLIAIGLVVANQQQLFSRKVGG
ncbi:DMT family transporter [Rhodopseudomonas pseudopalustris]|uniref:EamA-like transporter family protein n=1 Tax=Rhodopseudomonas pseudopalustris TaxID=1513892 RepID=A0A1H8LJM3_9BRAD|nr:DMT family transporter [Rhodopseudomonas pseudopalustris]MBB1090225.1 DMT family transporter [Rhodopseudomonas palustris]SEO05361.1 EamA-like transporter family protein [Rhodopseudomonas pseudopalustris]